MDWESTLNFKPLLHQMEGLAFAERHHYSINGFPMGCLSGDTKVKINRGGCSREYTLRQAFKRHNKTWTDQATSKIRGLKEERIGLIDVVDIVYSGVKQVYEVTLADGKKLKATRDHKFLTEAGWVRCCDLGGNHVRVDNTRHSNPMNIGHGVPEFSKVTSVDYIGWEDTYDICCKAPHHNFVANGMVVHNSGKSLIGVMLSLKHSKKTLVVCPAFLKRNWEKEFDKFCKIKKNIRVLFSKDLKNFKPKEEDVLVVNYEIITKCRYLFAWANLIICDESHYLSNPSAKRTMALAEFIETERPERLLMMSGSPIRGKVPQWFSPIYIASLNPFKTSGVDIRRTHYNTFWNFQKNFCNETMMRLGNRTVTKFDGLKNVEELKRILKNKYIRTVPSFKLDLPTLFTKVVEVDYSKMDKELEEAWNSYQKGKRLEDHVSSAKKSSALNKVPFTFNYVKNILEEEGGPAVIYSDHVDPVKTLAKMFNSKGIKAEYICGDVSTEIRNKYVSDFQDGKIEVLVATIGAASTGITLTKANNLVFNDISWINTENDQALKRIHRIGQDRECVIHYVAGSTIDKLIVRTVTKKDEVMKRTVEI